MTQAVVVQDCQRGVLLLVIKLSDKKIKPRHNHDHGNLFRTPVYIDGPFHLDQQNA
jgi:hypothetical protein